MSGRIQIRQTWVPKSCVTLGMLFNPFKSFFPSSFKIGYNNSAYPAAYTEIIMYMKLLAKGLVLSKSSIISIIIIVSIIVRIIAIQFCHAPVRLFIVRVLAQLSSERDSNITKLFQSHKSCKTS